LLAFVSASLGQTETATLSGLITDPQGQVVPGVAVEVTNVDTNMRVHQTTNGAGLYVAVGLKPGRYRVSVTKEGFRRIDLTDLVLNVQDVLSRNFQLQLGPVMASITVVAEDTKVNTTDATVSTVVDRNFADNLPMNGRSFQTLIQLTPGVVLTPSNGNDGGQFSVNGQRASSNYWMVDGVSANIGAAPSSQPGNSASGALFGFSSQGGTNSLVSVDALQEFRILTSTYAPEFGRTPGGQISIVTRSGTNLYHGTLFDYFRNDVLDANDWFADSKGLPKPQERQNDFGGIFSGPILTNRTFFFFSYEGLRLRLPQVGETTVPDLNARNNSLSTIQPFLNVYPLPNGPEVLDIMGQPSGAAQFNASFANRSTLDAYSLRIDHQLNEKLTLFGRYNYSPSENLTRGFGGFDSLSELIPSRITTQTATVGATWTASQVVSNDLRINYSKSNALSSVRLDNFGGAIPLTSAPFPSPFTSQDASFGYSILSLAGGSYQIGKNAHNLQRQFNLVDNLSVQRGSHSLKFGVDFRRLSPLFEPLAYQQVVSFSDVPSAESGSLSFAQIVASRGASFLFRNLGVFAQDTWRMAQRLTLTYGVRWDVDFAPSTTSGPSFVAITNFNLHDLSTLAVAPPGTPPYKTPYGSVAPRVGVAYQFSQKPRWETVLRGGFGVFYDLATSEFGNNIGYTFYPFGALNSVFGGTFPLDSATAAPPPLPPPSLSSIIVYAFDPNLKLPYTLEWNAALEQRLGGQQTISASYIGAQGRRLISTAEIFSPNPNLGGAQLVTNIGNSDYNALQLQFERRLSRSFQTLASYTWSHSIDTGSAGSIGNPSNALVLGINPNVNRGSSNFDIRSAFSAAVTYEVPTPKINAFTNAILHGWSLQSVIQARSAPPVDVFNGSFFGFFGVLNGLANVRPDVVPGVPLYLYGPQYPGGKAFNNTPGAVVGGCPDGSQSVGPFCPPPTDVNGFPLRQGNLGRNALRGFGATQWDLSVHRDFPIHESLKLQFRAEMFNVLNHPNFGQPIADLSNITQFGRSTQMLGRYLAGNSVGFGGFSPLYQIGGPRSIQFALKVQF